MDDPTVQWSEGCWNKIRSNLTPFLVKAGYGESNLSFVPVSGLTGENIFDPVDAKVCPWYKGKTLVQVLDELPIQVRQPSDPLRISVLEKTKDGAVYAHGRIESGSIRIGDKLTISPSGLPAQVGAILDHKNDSVLFARPGENV